MISENYAWTFGERPHLRLIKSSGCQLWLDDGNQYFDLTAGGSHFAILGHSNPIIKESITTTFDKYTHFDIKTLWTEELIELSNLIVSNSHLPASEYRFFLPGCNGADANESAIRLAFQAQWNRGNFKKKWIISRNQSYHGMSADALALSDRNNLNSQKTTLSPYRRLIPQHNPIYAKYLGFSESEYLEQCLFDFKKAITEIGSENIAAFIGETILGGLIGDVPPLKNYWKEMHSICREENIYLISDEVYCGTGTTGTLHSCEQDDIRPDFLTMGKTLCAGASPLSGILLKNNIYNYALGDDQRLQFSNTFQGHFMGVSASLAVQRIILSEGFLEGVRRKGNKIMTQLRANLENNPIFMNIRGRGLRISLEFSCKDRNIFAQELHKELMSRGIFNICKWHRLSITPPLIVTDEEIDFIILTISESFELISQRFEPMPISYEWLTLPTPTR